MLDVYLYEKQVGRLWEDESLGILFQYGDRALAEPERYRLSVSLPVRQEAYRSQGRNFFDNLLPEGDAREALAVATKFDRSDVAGLLGEVGGECAGAVSLWPPDTQPPDPEAWTYHELELSEVAQAVRGRAGDRSGSGLSARQSLSGVHNKLVVLRRGERLLLPAAGAPGNVIVKRAHSAFDGMTANELACLGLLGATGAPVSEARPLTIHDDVLLESRRYDRLESSDGTLRRLHQEDLCQATGRSPRAKYHEHGGPTFAEVQAILRRNSLAPLEDLKHLVQWMFVNFLIGNCDGHAKNLSLLYEDEGIRLAPFYDVASTDVYDGLDRTFALHVGGRSTPAALDGYGVRKFARSVAMNPKRVRELGEETADAVEFSARDVFDRVAGLTEHPAVLDRIGSLMATRLAELRGVLREI
ncbi:MAG: HipA domain-containing protein [Gemmatimonadota bacterium]